jgi:beta-1,4-mannosyl-glycoprotein beta-1,4-N-acetylglucosaminyltransferase
MIYDCFTFFNELDLLEIRLETLNDVVDKFVLVEATKTFRGENKVLYFKDNQERFAKFLKKIIYIVRISNRDAVSTMGVRILSKKQIV